MDCFMEGSPRCLSIPRAVATDRDVHPGTVLEPSLRPHMPPTVNRLLARPAAADSIVQGSPLPVVRPLLHLDRIRPRAGVRAFLLRRIMRTVAVL